MSKMRSFRMDDDLYARLGEIAEDRKTTRTEVLRDLILHEHAKWYIAAIAGPEPLVVREAISIS